MKKKKEKFKITEQQMSGYLGDSKFNQAILWLLTIPKEELSDSMFSAYKEMEKNGQNEIWLIDHFEQKLSEEIVEFVDWNDNVLKVKTSL
jgi:HD-GYP domain-containing protein (c-di-GMP phosphodiesterase class II)